MTENGVGYRLKGYIDRADGIHSSQKHSRNDQNEKVKNDDITEEVE